MREFDAELKDLREQIARLRRNTVRLETLRGQEAEALADAERLRRVWSAEQKDVEDLGRLSFAPLRQNSPAAGKSGWKEKRQRPAPPG